eukprot:Sspe_Gene.63774::Locus_36935_Transcript_1_1_Confidence_1.000_Length_1470::g.63774::m.63774
MILLCRSSTLSCRCRLRATSLVWFSFLFSANSCSRPSRSCSLLMSFTEATSNAVASSCRCLASLRLSSIFRIRWRRSFSTFSRRRFCSTSRLSRSRSFFRSNSAASRSILSRRASIVLWCSMRRASRRRASLAFFSSMSATRASRFLLISSALAMCESMVFWSFIWLFTNFSSQRFADSVSTAFCCSLNLSSCCLCSRCFVVCCVTILSSFSCCNCSAFVSTSVRCSLIFCSRSISTSSSVRRMRRSLRFRCSARCGAFIYGESLSSMVRWSRRSCSRSVRAVPGTTHPLGDTGTLVTNDVSRTSQGGDGRWGGPCLEDVGDEV